MDNRNRLLHRPGSRDPSPLEQDRGLDEARRRIRAAYDPAAFESAGRSVVGEVASFLARAQASSGAVLNWAPPEANIAAAVEMMRAGATPATLAKESLARGQTIHDPRYVGHQVPAPLPLAALMEMVSSISNQGMTVYEMGPWSSAVERVMIDLLGRELGLRPGFGGILTSGGSLANLTALLSARNLADREAWRRGLRGGGDVIISHEENHYSVERAAGILGIGAANCLKARVDWRRKMDPTRLDDQLRRLRTEGRGVIAVVAAAGSTRAGVFDPLDEIAEVCERHDVRLHVDAAHGGAAALSPRYAFHLKGIERAASVTWDAHKMLFIPALSTYLFYQQADDQYHAVSQEASYLFDPVARQDDAYNTGLGTIECTKRAAALSLWACWSVYGRGLFADLVDVTFGMARACARRLEAEPDFELLAEPESNVVLFRHRPAFLQNVSDAAVSRYQARLRTALIRSGEAYIVPAIDAGVGALRMVVMNPLTTEDHFEGLIATLRSLGRAIGCA